MPSKTTINGSGQVDQFLDKLNHPRKSEVRLLRAIIKGADKGITEQIKWNAPSFSYNSEE